MKQQVSALLRGEDLPEGAQAREIAEVPYEVPVVPGAKQHAQSASRSSRPTTGQQCIWASTGVRNSHVVSVGRF